MVPTIKCYSYFQGHSIVIWLFLSETTLTLNTSFSFFKFLICSLYIHMAVEWPAVRLTTSDQWGSVQLSQRPFSCVAWSHLIWKFYTISSLLWTAVHWEEAVHSRPGTSSTLSNSSEGRARVLMEAGYRVVAGTHHSSLWFLKIWKYRRCWHFENT